MVNVRAFHRAPASIGLVHAERILCRVPTVGAFLQLQPRGAWYVVRAVMFGAIQSAIEAELYVEKVNKRAFLAAFTTLPGEDAI